MANQKKTTRNLSGPSKDRFFERFYSDVPELDQKAAEDLTNRSKAVFTSVRVRNSEWPVARDLRRATGRAPIKSDAENPTEKPAPQPAKIAPPAPKPAKSDKTANVPSKTPAAEPPQPPTAPPAKAKTAKPATPPSPDAAGSSFDPFVFGLVPIFKREGADGLRDKLATIAETENLRAMAKNQQIILPREIRRGEVEAQTVRDAILAAVEQRVTDRKAQL
ncbi:MAG: hypothetical protein K0U74_13580 [Alphaproteobacteria bacterium]|nr:hypothetical protein [Alphaproteobacteria bacterium]